MWLKWFCEWFIGTAPSEATTAHLQYKCTLPQAWTNGTSVHCCPAVKGFHHFNEMCSFERIVVFFLWSSWNTDHLLNCWNELLTLLHISSDALMVEGKTSAGIGSCRAGGLHLMVTSSTNPQTEGVMLRVLSVTRRNGTLASSETAKWKPRTRCSVWKASGLCNNLVIRLSSGWPL